MQWAKCPGRPVLPIHLPQVLGSRNIVAKHVLVPAVDLHSAPVRFGQHLSDNIQFAMVRGAGLFQNCIFVKLSMGCGVISTMKIQIVFLFPVVGQGLIGNLTAGDAASVSKSGKENGVGGATLLENIQHLLGPFIDERNRSDLDPNHFLRNRLLRPSQQSGGQSGSGQCDRTALNEITTSKFGGVFIHSRMLNPEPVARPAEN